MFIPKWFSFRESWAPAIKGKCSIMHRLFWMWDLQSRQDVFFWMLAHHSYPSQKDRLNFDIIIKNASNYLISWWCFYCPGRTVETWFYYMWNACSSAKELCTSWFLMAKLEDIWFWRPHVKSEFEPKSGLLFLLLKKTRRFFLKYDASLFQCQKLESCGNF